jgi:hypothetical protein
MVAPSMTMKAVIIGLAVSDAGEPMPMKAPITVGIIVAAVSTYASQTFWPSVGGKTGLLPTALGKPREVLLVGANRLQFHGF